MNNEIKEISKIKVDNTVFNIKDLELQNALKILLRNMPSKD